MHRVLLFFIACLASSIVWASSQVEAEFLDKVSKSHRESIHFSQTAIEKSSDPRVKKLARSILENQLKEQKQMSSLQKKFYNDKDTSTALNSEISPAPSFEGMSGTQFDKSYLQAMTKHHKESIEMMGKMMPNIDRRAIHRLAIKMVKKQGNEISKLEKLEKSIQ